MIMLNTKKKIFWLSIFLSLSALLLITALVINPLLKKVLVKQVEDKLVGNFSYGYENLKVNLIKRSVTFENVNWKFPKDTTLFNQSGFIRRFNIEGISILSFFGGSNISINEILFDSLVLETRIKRFSKKDSITTNETFNFYSLIRGQIKGVNIKSIQIKNGNATWLHPEHKKVWGKINDVQLIVNSFTLDSATTAANNGWFSFQNILLEGVTGELYLADSLHKIRTTKMLLDYLNNKIIIDSVRLIPLFTKSQMKYVRKYETNRLEMAVACISITGIDINRLMVKNELRIEKILIDQLQLAVFRDKNPPFPPHHFPPLPQLALKHARLNVKIDSVSINNAFVSYEQLSEKTQKVGKVFFEGIHAELTNITNDSISYKQNARATLHASTQLMGISKLTVNAVFDLSNPSGDHRISGSLGTLDLTTLNKIFEPLTSASIRSGVLNQLQFTIRLNNEVSDGEVRFLYDNLKLDKLSSHDLSLNSFDNTIKSLLANTFVIKSSNPSGRRDPRIGVVHFKRAKEKAIFDFWLKSVVDGIKSIVLSGTEKGDDQKIN